MGCCKVIKVIIKVLLASRSLPPEMRLLRINKNRRLRQDEKPRLKCAGLKPLITLLL